MKYICVYGSSSDAIKQEYLDAAFELGAQMARKDCRLVFGAGKIGVMGAVARGIHENGGRMTGVLPEFMNLPGIPYEACDELILTQTMRERKQKMEDLSDGFIAVPGGIGTLEELLEVLTLKQLARHEKPIVILNTDGYYNELIAMLEKSVSQKFAKDWMLRLYSVAADGAQAVEQILQYQPFSVEKKWF